MKDKLQVTVTADEVYKRKSKIKIMKAGILLLLLFLFLVYLVLYVVNNEGYFTISLDPNLKATKSIAMSPYEDFRDVYLNIKVKSLEYMDNISEKWIPKDITEYQENHSGDNYLAYSFFLKNNGEENVNYYREIIIESVVKKVDDAVRIAVYFNGEKTTYAKASANGDPEPETTSFSGKYQVMKEERIDFKPGDVDKYTIVIWLEGDDPECVDDIIGGEMRLIMLIKEIRKD